MGFVVILTTYKYAAFPKSAWQNQEIGVCPGRDNMIYAG